MAWLLYSSPPLLLFLSSMISSCVGLGLAQTPEFSNNGKSPWRQLSSMSWQYSKCTTVPVAINTCEPFFTTCWHESAHAILDQLMCSCNYWRWALYFTNLCQVANWILSEFSPIGQGLSCFWTPTEDRWTALCWHILTSCALYVTTSESGALRFPPRLSGI